MKTTVYLNKTAEDLFQRAKEFNPDYSISNAVEEGLRVFVDKMNIQYTGMDEQIATTGSNSSEGFFGNKVKFVGKKLASTNTNQVDPEIKETQTLYLTKKGKYLIQADVIDLRDGESKHMYEICHTVKELQEKASPVLLVKAGNTAGELLEELDI